MFLCRIFCKITGGRLFAVWIQVEFRIDRIEILAVQVILDNSQGFAETLIMHNLPLPEELDRIADFRVFYKTQDVVIGCAGFLLCCDLVKTTAAENLEKALFFVVQAVSCCDFIRTKIEKKEDETNYPA